jgi:hypothetical protein
MSHSRSGCFGLILGSLLGLLLAALFFIFLGRQATAPAASPAVTPTADVSLYLSEQILTRLAAETLEQPVAIDFEPGGQLEVTLPVELMGLEPVVRLGLSLERQGSGVISQLHWARLGLIKIPADWLPPEAVDAATLLGATITQQIPPEFRLVGLSTTPDGLTFQLAWTQPNIK